MPNISPQSYDLLMVAVFAFSALFGAWKGMAWQIAAVAALVLSTAMSLRFGGPLAPYVSHEEPWNRFLAMLILYVGTSLVVWLLFRAVAKFINRVQLREFDHQLGALLGGVKGALWCILISFFAVTLSEPARQVVLHSRSGHYIAVLTQRAEPILPQEVRAHLGKYLEELDRKLDPKTPPEPSAETSASGGPGSGELKPDRRQPQK
ncbi:MAG: CvpA family protein [Thermoguttaceae bacterium]|jgi:membrane protein required for colicin V production